MKTLVIAALMVLLFAVPAGLSLQDWDLETPFWYLVRAESSAAGSITVQKTLYFHPQSTLFAEPCYHAWMRAHVLPQGNWTIGNVQRHVGLVEIGASSLELGAGNSAPQLCEGAGPAPSTTTFDLPAAGSYTFLYAIASGWISRQTLSFHPTASVQILHIQSGSGVVSRPIEAFESGNHTTVYMPPGGWSVIMTDDARTNLQISDRLTGFFILDADVPVSGTLSVEGPSPVTSPGILWGQPAGAWTFRAQDVHAQGRTIHLHVFAVDAPFP